jgi:hypothetical protein
MSWLKMAALADVAVQVWMVFQADPPLTLYDSVPDEPLYAR